MAWLQYRPGCPWWQRTSHSDTGMFSLSGRCWRSTHVPGGTQGCLWAVAGFAPWRHTASLHTRSSSPSAWSPGVGCRSRKNTSHVLASPQPSAPLTGIEAQTLWAAFYCLQVRVPKDHETFCSGARRLCRFSDQSSQVHGVGVGSIPYCPAPKVVVQHLVESAGACGGSLLNPSCV